MFIFALWCVCDDFHVYDLYYIILYLLKLFYNHIIYNLVVDMTVSCSLDEVSAIDIALASAIDCKYVEIEITKYVMIIKND